jgi:hypothetical protein
VVLKGLSRERTWLKTVSIDRSLLKGEAPIFSADFIYPFSCEWPFLCHLVRPLGIDNIIAMLDNIHSAIIKLTRTRTRIQTRTWTRTQARTWTWTRPWKWNTFVSYQYGAIWITYMDKSSSVWIVYDTYSNNASSTGTLDL